MAILNFKGKPFVQNYHLSVKYHELIPQKSKSLAGKVCLTGNLIIHGDNLKALKALLPNYASKVKCIYIDPPYNTGNEKWMYNDNVNSPMMQEWFGKVVDTEDLTRHDKWLAMMTPRLKLLRELLRDDGVIFVSIDDNEVQHLRMLMDEIFGENNFVSTIIWEKKYAPQNDARWLSENHDYVIMFAKNKATWRPNLLPRTEEANARYSNLDNDPRGVWKSTDFSRKAVEEKTIYEIRLPSGRKVTPPKGRSWLSSPEEFERLKKEGRIWFGPNGDAVPSVKRFLYDVKQGMTSLTIWKRDEVGDTQEGRQIIREIFGDIGIFETPKSVRLIRKMLLLSTTSNAGDIIMDSFSGSGTTAHAVLALNKEDGGNRQFILIECEDYADEVTAERVRRIVKGLPKAKDENLKKGLGGSFSYFELGRAIELERILDGKHLPAYEDLARYLFYTATGEEFDEKQVDEKKGFIGESREREVYLFYQPDIESLRRTALTLDRAKGLGKYDGKRRLVFAPTKFMDQDMLDEMRIDFAQLPFEIYKFAD